MTPFQTPLCEIAYNYGTDKCPQLKHSYTPFYYEIFKDKRNSIKKVLELGIGHYKNMQNVEVIYDPGLKRYYHKGASLKMWRDFFPNAEVYGADRVPESMFSGERIKTYLCDETKKEELEKLIRNTENDIDLLIDDASHHLEDQIFACFTLMPLLKKDVVYIIEDVRRPKQIARTLVEYDCYIPPISTKKDPGQLVVVRNKQLKISV